jgi:mitogen-activated protein kinase 15
MIENIDQKILGRFEIIQKIRKTNSGVVWKAIDRKANDVVAIKKVNPA